MDWTINLKPKAERELASLDKQSQKRIINYLENRLAKLSSPRRLGSPLQGKLKSFWKYRVGDYRLICDIQDETVTILVISVGHRKDIYKTI